MRSEGPRRACAREPSKQEQNGSRCAATRDLYRMREQQDLVLVCEQSRLGWATVVGNAGTVFLEVRSHDLLGISGALFHWSIGPFALSV